MPVFVDVIAPFLRQLFYCRVLVVIAIPLLLCLFVAMKTVLVSLGDNNRVVSFCSSQTILDSDALTEAVKAVFQDVLPPGQEFFLQLKSEDWGGVFLDLLPVDREIPDKSVIRAVLRKPAPEVAQTAISPEASTQSWQSFEKENPRPNSIQLQLSTSSHCLGLRKPTAAELEDSYSLPSGQQADKSTEYIKEQSKIYGRNSKSELTTYQKQINDAAAELCLHNHNLLSDRKLLLETARRRLHESGYSYKKGSSRSKTLNPGDEKATPKQRKISQDYRLTRIAEVEEKIKDLGDQIGFKEKRRECASAIRNYKECDILTEQISTLKSEKRQFEVELSSLTKRQSKSAWYHRKKRSSHSSDASSTDNAQMIGQASNSLACESLSTISCVPSPFMQQSPGRHFSPPSPCTENQSSCTPSPSSSRLTTPSPHTLAVRRPPVMPRSRSPPLSVSESECTNDDDTVILSSEDDTPNKLRSFVSSPPPFLRRSEAIWYQRPTHAEELPATTTAAGNQHFQ